jgi:hypothetical protein
VSLKFTFKRSASASNRFKNVNQLIRATPPKSLEKFFSSFFALKNGKINRTKQTIRSSQATLASPHFHTLLFSFPSSDRSKARSSRRTANNQLNGKREHQTLTEHSEGKTITKH